MKLRKAHVLAFLALVVALSGVFAVYQFYVKDRLSEYNQHLTTEKQLRDKINLMAEKFSSTKPDVLLASKRGLTEPLAEEVRRMSNMFDRSTKIEVEKVPEEEKAYAKFYYEKAHQPRVTNLQQAARVANCAFSPNFGVPAPDTLANANPTAEMVEDWLKKMDDYAGVAKLLIDKGANSIEEISMWPQRSEKVGKDSALVFYTVGLRFTMKLLQLTAFLDELRLAKEYWTVEGIFLSTTQLRAGQDPSLSIQLVLSQAEYNAKENAPASGAGAVGGGAALSRSAMSNAFAGLDGQSPFSSGFGGGRAGEEQKPGFLNWLNRYFNPFR